MTDGKMPLISSSPHIRSRDSVRGIMLDVIIALTPAAVMGLCYFGVRAALIILISVCSAVFFEFLYGKLKKRQGTVNDLSAVVSGLLLALCLPQSVPYWVPVVGAAFAILIAKQLFGGLGQNFINPALAARAFLLAAYPVIMTNWTVAAPGFLMTDAVSGATPLALLKEGAVPDGGALFMAFTGNTAGCIGETCAAALLLGFVYLLFRRVISWRIPVSYLATFALLAWVFGRDGGFTGDPLYELCVGGVLLGAVFMATDYSTSPVMPRGQIIMGIGCGLITAVIRFHGSYPEGVTYAILLMNLAVPLIDRYTKPKKFGSV